MNGTIGDFVSATLSVPVSGTGTPVMTFDAETIAVNFYGVTFDNVPNSLGVFASVTVEIGAPPVIPLPGGLPLALGDVAALALVGARRGRAAAGGGRGL